MLKLLQKSIQNLFVVSNGYSIASYSEDEKFVPNWSIELIRSLDEEQFVQLCIGYFEEKCYQARTVSLYDADEIDVWLFKDSYSKEKPFGLIKCWHQKAIPVEQKDVNGVMDIISKNQIPFGAFITAGNISNTVPRNLNKQLRLIDGLNLLELINKLPVIRNQRLQTKISNLIHLHKKAA